MVQPSAPRLVTVPAPDPARYGLESAIAWLDSEDAHTFLGVEFDNERCDAARLTNGLFCIDNDSESPFGVPKESTPGVDVTKASPFAIYGEYSCNPISRSNEAFDRARRHLELGRSRAIERAVQFGEPGNEPSLVSAATDITPGSGAVGLAEALAIVEQHLGENYGGTGVIHMDRSLAMRALSDYGLLIVDGETLRTGLGTPVVAGAGYDLSVGPDESPAESPADGTTWIYATGALYGWQSEVGFIPDSLSGAVNRSTNMLTVLAEQMIVVAWECLTIAIQVDTSVSDDLLGDVNVNNFPAQTGLTDDQLRASAVPVSGTVALDGATLGALENTSVTVTGLPTAVRVEGITRYATAGTRTVGAGKRSYSVQVVTAASAASPTLGGVALPTGWSGEFTAPGNDTLTGLSLVTVGVDDVIVTEI